MKSDNWGKYCDSKIEEFYDSRTIKRVKTVPKNPHQKEVAKRMNRTILELARSIRIHAGLLKHIWTNAANTALYLINRRSCL